MKTGKAGALVLVVAIVALALLRDDQPAMEQRVYLPFVARSHAQSVQLVNPGFEGGYGGKCEFYNAKTGFHSFCYDEQDVPLGWTFGWYEGFGANLCYNGKTGRPEAALSDRRHPGDVYAGDYSAHAFTFWRCGRFWWEQSVLVEPGSFYTFIAWVRTWPGNSNIQARVCNGANCTDWTTTNGAWMRLEKTAMAESETLRVRAECRAVWPDGVNNDCWVDAAWIQEATGE